MHYWIFLRNGFYCTSTSTVSKCSLDLYYSFFVQPRHCRTAEVQFANFCYSSNQKHQNKWEGFQVYVAFSEKLDFIFEDSLIFFQVVVVYDLEFFSGKFFLLYFNFLCIMTLYICSVGFFLDPSFHGLLETIIKFEF